MEPLYRGIRRVSPDSSILEVWEHLNYSPGPNSYPTGMMSVMYLHLDGAFPITCNVPNAYDMWIKFLACTIKPFANLISYLYVCMICRLVSLPAMPTSTLGIVSLGYSVAT